MQRNNKRAGKEGGSEGLGSPCAVSVRKHYGLVVVESNWGVSIR